MEKSLYPLPSYFCFPYILLLFQFNCKMIWGTSWFLPRPKFHYRLKTAHQTKKR